MINIFPKQSYNTDFGLSVSNRLKMKIISGYCINFSLLIENPYEVDPHDVTKGFFSINEVCLTFAPKSKTRVITDIQVLTDAFLIYASIYESPDQASTTPLFKYVHTIRLGASRVKSIGFRGYDIQFRLPCSVIHCRGNNILGPTDAK